MIGCFHIDRVDVLQCDSVLAGADGQMTAYPVDDEFYCKTCAREVKSANASDPNASVRAPPTQSVAGGTEPKALGSVLAPDYNGRIAHPSGGKTRFDRLAEDMGTHNPKTERKW